jgi:DNA-binding CsgD family transcriptional regulator
LKILNCLVYLVAFWLSFSIQAQERPPINIFNPEDYGAIAQNWSISQANNRYIYVANNKGLLEYNGAKWNLYPSPNETILRCVKVVDSLIYTGSYHEFGYWKKDDFGVLNYTSLSEVLQIEFIEDEEFWNIHSLENWVLFQSLNRIIIYDRIKNSYHIINSKTVISRLFKVDDNLYFQNLNNGLFKIENGKDVLVSEDSIIKNNVIVNIFGNNEALFILTQDNGFYTLKNHKIETWVIPASKVLQDVSVFCSIQLQDESFVLGTISDGIIHLTKNGEVSYIINQSDGLSNNTVLALYEDIDNNIWLGLDNGINCINIKSPYLIFHDINGTIGSVYASAVYNNFIYLGTNQGLFCKPLDSNESFKFIEGTQGQVWCIEVFNNQLFCGHNMGTFLVKNNRAKIISDVPGTWQIKPFKNLDNVLVQGNYNGLHVLELDKTTGNWQLKNKVTGFNISSRYFEFLNKNQVFVNHEYKGVFNLQVNNELTEVNSYKLDSLLKKGLYSSLTKHKGTILYSSKNGVYKYNTGRNVFEKDAILSQLINKEKFTSGKLVSDEKTDKLWSFSSDGISYLTTSKLSGDKEVNSIHFPVDVRKDIVGFENIIHITDQKYLFGTTTGYIILDLNKVIHLDHKININQITISQSKHNDSIRLVNLKKPGEFKNHENNLTISYSISEFLKTQKPEYRYKLEGIYDEWSDWTLESSVYFENLPYGNYTFSVMGKVGSETSNNIETFSFKIARPWYLTNLAIAFYLFSIFLFSLVMHNIYKRYYRKQRERLMLKTTKEFELKELENKQQLMRFKNEKLKEDIDNKNRELAASTMNLIKKNEFLNTIKKELETSQDDKNLKGVIKIIDRNLNNTDDWNLFQEAFNNADKDFLKKIKTLHPNLTSNDLRLCAYLRLNLSSKEIAPLLNISSRSVEVKRYRLRKKMDLPHESSLTDYILEI